MSSISSRIKLLRQLFGVTQKQFGLFCGVSKPAVSQWETEKSEPTQGPLEALRISRNVNPRWVLYGEEPMLLRPSDQAAQMAEAAALYGCADGFANVVDGPAIRGLVPVISWVQAGQWSEAVDLYAPGDGQEWAACSASHGPRTFALRVQGDSMTAPYGLSVPDGMLIFVDPDQRGGVVSGNLVVARLCNTDDVTFKQFVEDAGRRFLRPLNPHYPTIHDEFLILGLVVGAFMDLRRPLASGLMLGHLSE